MRDLVLDDGQRQAHGWNPIALPGGPQPADADAAQPLRPRAALARDVLVLLAAAAATLLAQLPWRGAFSLAATAHVAALFALTAVAFGGLLALAGVAERGQRGSALLTYTLLTASPTILAALAVAAPAAGLTAVQRGTVLLAAAVGLAAASLSHLTWQITATRVDAHQPSGERVILVGPAAQARQVEERLRAAAPQCPVVASVGAADGARALGLLPEALAALATGSRPSAVVVTAPHLTPRQLRETRTLCAAYGLRCLLMPDTADLPADCPIGVARLGSLVFLAALPDPRHTWYPPLKRGIDVAAAAALLFLLTPLFILIALLIKLDSPGPVFYRQERVGRGNRPFSMLKFRSMAQDAEHRVAELLAQNEADGPLFKMRSDPRVTRVGRVLRRLSIDELPQLINVLIGEMSLVGPRPPLRREVDQYEPWQYGRLAATPGVTGLWQVSGRSDLSFQEGVALDLQYIRRCSLRLDAIILLRTIPAVLRCRGAY